MLSRSRAHSRLGFIELSRLVSVVLVLLALLLSGWALQRGFSFVRLGLAYAAPLDEQEASHFVAEIRAGRFSAMILPMDVWQDGLDDAKDRWTPEMLQAVRDAYTIKFKDSRIIYVPRAQVVLR